ncbi:hypothetical protein TSACC_23363 [Terrimicrobium sacchariphilum]|uniref:Uncharacterized protein n=1 Tax=Terrimicrobium sacchariphilum TaxID=690879 RepID=A0A146GBB9_TERSA|nr:hypothetical protein [Terrimicrobium sacchariphilum]GAT34929.1 hypothetical protein TSACC_23363 [Terrimicrobium sacchariphilum]
MKTPSQFWTLFRFHVMASPWIWGMAIVLGLQGFFGMSWFYRNLDLALSGLNFALWIPVALAVVVVRPEFYAGSQANASTQRMLYCADFLFTRAVDRGMVFRCRGLLYWAMILSVAISWLSVAAFRPSFTLELPANAGFSSKSQYYLEHIPGSFVQKTSRDGDVTIEAVLGNLQIKTVMVALTIGFGALWLVVVSLMATVPFRLWIIWGFSFGGMMAMMFFGILRGDLFEPFLLFGLGHLPLCLGVALLCALGAEWFVERRLASLEFM